MRVRKARSAASSLVSSSATKCSRSGSACAAGAAAAARVAAGVGGRQRELQAEGPAFGQVVQTGGGVVVDPVAEALAHHFERLLELEAQHRLRHQRALPVVDQVFDAEAAVGARGHHRAQVGRRVAQHVGQGVDRCGRQPLGFVHEQHHVEGRLRHLGQPDREALEARHRPRFEQGVAEGRPPGAGAHGECQRLEQALRAVLRLRADPRHNRAVRQVLAPPLGEQRCLAEAGRCLDEDQRVVAQAFGRRRQTRTRHQMPLHAWRSDLEQQVVGGPGLGRKRGSCHRAPTLNDEARQPPVRRGRPLRCRAGGCPYRMVAPWPPLQE